MVGEKPRPLALSRKYQAGGIVAGFALLTIYFSGQFALVKRSDGTEQITYDGMPLYTLKGAKPLLTTGNGQGGVWHVIKLSASNIG